MTRPTTEAISPFFIVSNVDETIGFYRDKLGFETRFQQPERNPFFARRRCLTPGVIPPFVGMPSSTHQTPMLSLPNLPIMAQPSAPRLRILTTVCVASRLATPMATCCSSATQSSGSLNRSRFRAVLCLHHRVPRLWVLRAAVFESTQAFGVRPQPSRSMGSLKAQSPRPKTTTCVQPLKFEKVMKVPYLGNRSQGRL